MPYKTVTKHVISLVNEHKNLVNELKLDIENRESYDVSNMSSAYTGLKSGIKIYLLNSYFFPPHSLNRVGCFATGNAYIEATVFLSFVQELLFFINSLWIRYTKNYSKCNKYKN